MDGSDIVFIGVNLLILIGNGIILLPTRLAPRRRYRLQG